MRRTYAQFARLVERGRREVLREFPSEMASIPVETVAYSASVDDKGRPIAQTRTGTVPLTDPWGEFYQPKGPIILYQFPYEYSGVADYYGQIKDVLRHEFSHAMTLSWDDDDPRAWSLDQAKQIPQIDWGVQPWFLPGWMRLRITGLGDTFEITLP